MRIADLNGVWLLKELSTEKDDILGAFEHHDNDCFDMIPGVKRRVEVALGKPIRLGNLQKRMQFSHCG